MRKTFRSLIDSKVPFIGAFNQLASIELAEMMAYSGFDFILIDMEHSLIDQSTAVHMLRAVEGAGAATMIRLPEVNEDLIKRALDMGAGGIMVCGVRSYEDALDAVKFAKFKPLGERGACPAVRANRYGLANHTGYYAKQNEETVVFVALEGPDVIKDIDRIAAIEGIDILGVGPVDLSVALGVPGQLNSPQVLEAITEVKRKANSNGKMYASFSEQIEDFLQMEEPADFYLLAGDIWMIGRMLKSLNKKIQMLKDKTKKEK